MLSFSGYSSSWITLQFSVRPYPGPFVQRWSTYATVFSYRFYIAHLDKKELNTSDAYPWEQNMDGIGATGAQHLQAWNEWNPSKSDIQSPTHPFKAHQEETGTDESTVCRFYISEQSTWRSSFVSDTKDLIYNASEWIDRSWFLSAKQPLDEMLSCA